MRPDRPRTYRDVMGKIGPRAFREGEPDSVTHSLCNIHMSVTTALGSGGHTLWIRFETSFSWQVCFPKTSPARSAMTSTKKGPPHFFQSRFSQVRLSPTGFKVHAPSNTETLTRPLLFVAIAGCVGSNRLRCKRTEGFPPSGQLTRMACRTLVANPAPMSWMACRFRVPTTTVALRCATSPLSRPYLTAARQEWRSLRSLLPSAKCGP